tara:strand:- start:7240 stop:7719 length:480 start_codon:yes stop_codon:yes gene_type:complete
LRGLQLSLWRLKHRAGKAIAMSLHIRTFRESDRRAAISLWQSCDLIRPWNNPSLDIDRAVKTRSSTLLVGEKKANRIASIMAGYDGHRGWIYYLAVDASERTRGYGREMMLEAELWLRSQSTPKLQLMVRSDNQTATAFYTALGYERQDVSVYGKHLND